MTRVNIFKLAQKISKEDLTEADLSKEEDLLVGDEAVDSKPEDLIRTLTTKGDVQGKTANSLDGTAQVADVGNVDVKIDTEGREQIEEGPEDADGMITASLEDDMAEMDAGGLTPEFDQTSEEVEELLEDEEVLERTTVAIESYIDILQSMREDRLDVSPQLAQSIRIGLEAFDPEFFMGSVVSVEDMAGKGLVPSGSSASEGQGEFTEDKGENARDVTESKLTTKLKEIGKAAYQILMRIINAVADLWQRVSTDMDKLNKELKELKRSSSDLTGNVEMTVKGLGRLSIGGEFVGDSPAVLDKVDKVANGILLKFPGELAKLIEKYRDGRTINFFSLSDTIKSGTWAGLYDGFNDILARSFNGISKSASSEDRDLIPSGFLNSSKILYTETLPGDRAVFIGMTEPNDTKKDIIGASVKIELSLVPGGDSTSSDQEITTMSGPEAIQVIGKLEKILSTVDASVNGSDALDKLVKEARKVQGDTFFNSQESFVSGVLVGKLISLSKRGNYLFVGYAISLIKAEIALIRNMIKVEDKD